MIISQSEKQKKHVSTARKTSIRHKENATDHAKNAVIRPRNALRVILIIRENWLSGLLRGIAEKAERGHRSILQDARHP